MSGTWNAQDACMVQARQAAQEGVRHQLCGMARWARHASLGYACFSARSRKRAALGKGKAFVFFVRDAGFFTSISGHGFASMSQASHPTLMTQRCLESSEPHLRTNRLGW